MAENQEAAEAAAPAPKKMKTRLILAVAGVVLLAVAGVGGAWALGVFGGDGADATAEAGADAGHETAAASQGEPAGDGDGTAAGQPIFVDLPHMLVNLASDGGGTRFLKLSVAVEVDDPATVERIEQLSPRIVDSFQLYLRTLRVDELRGPGAMFRLKEDLHVRIHQAIEPATVNDVLFKEMLVQ